MIKLIQVCDGAYDSYETNCSGFLKEVCKQLGITIDQGNADAIADFLDANWTELAGPADAKNAVDDKKFVVAALRSMTPIRTRNRTTATWQLLFLGSCT